MCECSVLSITLTASLRLAGSCTVALQHSAWQNTSGATCCYACKAGHCVEPDVRALNAQPAVELSRLTTKFAAQSLCRVFDTGCLAILLMLCLGAGMRRGTHMLARRQGEVAGSCYYVYAMREISQAPHALLKCR